ncbi:MAG TPA: molybdenum cofactor guanylyltransferase [Ktedonobacterales bacterium]|nr:molybdenum cofactor guanylyltransferase [Ktedonobacterales bacterium]
MGIPGETSAAQTTGVVLAGGASRRMGQEKARLVIQGEPLLARVTRLLRLAFSEVVVVGPPSVAELVPGFAVVPDTRAGQGPLAGLEAAFAATRTPLLFVVACDMPFLSPTLARRMTAIALAQPDAQVIALRSDLGVEPLHAVYRRACQPVVTALLENGERSLQALLARVRVAEVTPEDQARGDPAGLATLNVNTPEEWRHALLLAEAWRPPE